MANYEGTYAPGDQANPSGTPEASAADAVAMVDAAIAARRGEIDDEARQKHADTDEHEQQKAEFAAALTWARERGEDIPENAGLTYLIALRNNHREYLADGERAAGLRANAAIAEAAEKEADTTARLLGDAINGDELGGTEIANGVAAILRALSVLEQIDDEDDTYERARRSIAIKLAEALADGRQALEDRASGLTEEADNLDDSWAV